MYVCIYVCLYVCMYVWGNVNKSVAQAFYTQEIFIKPIYRAYNKTTTMTIHVDALSYYLGL